MLKRTALFVFVIALVFSSLGIAAEVPAAQKGPFIDYVDVNVRTNMDVGLQDTVAGYTDIFFYGVDGPVYFGLDQAAKDKLEVYEIPSGSWSLMLNPIPNAAPYQVNVEGETFFNPFAIRELRFALNFLINRKYIVDEILAGAGGPMFNMATPGQPGTYKYNLLADKYGFTPEGNESKAISDITAQMQMAAALPENAGRLVKGAKFWEFDGKPVTIKFLIRVDDPTGRLREGHYIADQIEKAGIAVERLLYDRSKCVNMAYYSNPADYTWHMYTEGWGAGATRAFWEHIVAQMYAPWYGYMAGGAEPTNWNYANAMIDEYTMNAYTGNFITEDEYWDLALNGLDLGLYDACRLYVAYQQQYYVANKDRFSQRFAYGLGDGLNDWSLITAKTADNALTITEYSAKGALFMAAWDPVGADGFSDVYSNVLAKPCVDNMTFESPVSAIPTPQIAYWKDGSYVSGAARDADGEIIGTLQVPADAIRYNSATQAWEEVGEGIIAKSSCTYYFNFSNYHDGTPMRLADVFYAFGFSEDYCYQDGENDARFEDAYASKLASTQETIKGWVENADESITVYYDYVFPPSEPRAISWGVPALSVSASGQGVYVNWAIDEALALLTTEGSRSGTEYSFSSQADNEIDTLIPSHVADIKAKLEDMAAARHVPVYFGGRMTEADCVEAYQNAIAFIEDHGNAFISTGMFFIDKYDAATSYMRLSANRNPDYPFTAAEWLEKFAVARLVVDSVTIPALHGKRANLAITVKTSKIVYPEITSEANEEGYVTAKFLYKDATGSQKELLGKSYLAKAGEFVVEFPGTELSKLPGGTYKVLIEANLEGAVSASTQKEIVLF